MTPLSSYTITPEEWLSAISWPDGFILSSISRQVFMRPGEPPCAGWLVRVTSEWGKEPRYREYPLYGISGHGVAETIPEAKERALADFEKHRLIHVADRKQMVEIKARRAAVSDSLLSDIENIDISKFV